MNFWEVVTMFGDLQFWIAGSLTSLILYLSVPKKLRKYLSWFIFLVLPSVVMSYSITSGLKLIFKVPRPCSGMPQCPTTYSFPRGHATVAFAALTSIGMYYGDKRLKLLLFVFASMIAYSRVALNVHYPLDVAVGSLIGFVTSILVWKAFVMWSSKT